MMDQQRQAKILYVEDDKTIAFLTRDNLEMRGYQVKHALDGQEAVELFNQESFDLCLVDIMLPRMDGFSFAELVRKKNSHIPILFLTARSMTDDKIRGLSIGGDDYITKPFSIDELVLRIEVFLRRSRVKHEPERRLFYNDDIQFDFSNQRLVIRSKQFNLTQRESELLHYLFEHANTILKREVILKDIWGDDDYFLGRSLDVFISRLRKIFSAVNSVRIENIHGVGFRFMFESSENLS